MLKQNNKIDFAGQKIFIGLDFHKKNWSVKILGEQLSHKSFSQPPKPDVLNNYLVKNFPNAEYHCVYEAGFSGFWAYRQLTDLGIHCTVVNPADVPTSDKEKKGKTDKVDCTKLAKCLRSGELESIYVPSIESEQDRTLVRTRGKLVGDLVRCKNRIKSFLCYFGIEIPESLQDSKWSKAFMKWLKEIELPTQSGKASLEAFIEEGEQIRAIMLKLTRQIRAISKTERYQKNVELLCSIPGIGLLSAMIILTEFENISRFKTLDDMCAYVGLMPNTYSSGERNISGKITNRGNSILRSSLVECAWVAARFDPALMKSFNDLTRRMEKNDAIIRICKKLVNRIRFVLKNQEPYKMGIS